MLTLPALMGACGIKVTAVCDARAEARERFAADHGVRAYGSLEEILRDPHVQALYIATPHELHCSQAIAAARAGKHILVEKPMATRIADCRAMIEAARAASIVMVIGPSHGFDEPVRRAASLVSSGAYGALRMITALNFTDFMYRPRRPEELDPQKGGGVVYSQAAHQFDVVRRLAGQPVKDVTAAAASWDHSRLADGAYTALARFSGGAAATLTYSGYAHYDSDELMDWVSELGLSKDPSGYGEARRKLAALSRQQELQAKLARTYGGTGRAAMDRAPEHNEHFGFVLASCDGADLKILPDGIWVYGDVRKEFLPVPAPMVPRAGAIMEFADAIMGEGGVTQDGEWGLDTMRCCEALIRSSALGRTVSLSELELSAG